MPPPVSTVPVQSVGYVTLGASHLTCAPSPNASPNLSVGSNDSLIAKTERMSPTAKISPLKRNGYVEAYVVAATEPAVCDLRPSVSPGYVTFKCLEPTVDMTRYVNCLIVLCGFGCVVFCPLIEWI